MLQVAFPQQLDPGQPLSDKRIITGKYACLEPGHSIFRKYLYLKLQNVQVLLAHLFAEHFHRKGFEKETFIANGNIIALRPPSALHDHVGHRGSRFRCYERAGLVAKKLYILLHPAVAGRAYHYQLHLPQGLLINAAQQAPKIWHIFFYRHYQRQRYGCSHAFSSPILFC